MDIINFMLFVFYIMEKIDAGTLLIADPFLKDPNFARSVIFLCDYKEGAFGFVTNRKSKYVAGKIITELENCDHPVFYGGPVQQNTVHFIHCCPGLITGGEKITEEIYWGGEYDEMIALLKRNTLTTQQIRLFLGYSGWSKEQLENEIKEKTWLSTYSSQNLVFNQDIKKIWPEAIKQLDSKYQQIINYPLDPQMN